MTIDIAVDLRPGLGPVRDQGPRPTCLSHAVTLAHEHARRDPAPLSPEYLHYFSSGAQPHRGVTFPDARDALEKTGQPEEAHCPYLPGTPPAGWAPAGYLDVFRRLSDSGSPSIQGIEDVISKGDIPILGIRLPGSFYRPRSPWVVRDSGSPRGLHAVAGTGIGMYHGERVTLIRNSWGVGWGDAGYVWLDEGFLRSHLKAMLILKDEVIT